MSLIQNIRQLYLPVQPTVQQKAERVLYQEFAPGLALQPYVYCYWQLKTTAPLEAPFFYRVVADGCIDIFFNLDQAEQSFVMGFCRKYTEFELEPTFNFVGIRFLPTMFPQLFGIDAAELSNRYAWLHEVHPATARFIQQTFHEGMDMPSIGKHFDLYLLQLLANVDFNTDHRLYEAIDIILKNSGMVQVEQELNTGISPRQLRRIFKYYIGDTAKTFCKVVRFQNILRAKPSGQSLQHNRLFFDTGYYDQAHFIKEFKTFYGATPSRAFGR